MSVTLVLQIVFNLWLLISMIHKRKSRVVDPIHSTISAARQNSKQLNKINFISLMMCLNCLLVNFSFFVIVIIVRSDPSNLAGVIKSRLVLEILCLLNLASKVPILILTSNRLKAEFVSLLKCRGSKSSRDTNMKKAISNRRKKVSFQETEGSWAASTEADLGL